MKHSPHLLAPAQEHRLNVVYDLVASTTLGVAIMTLVAMTGCVGYVDGGGGVAVEPDFWLFGGGYYGHGGDDHGYSHRGSESRAAAHGGGHHR